VLFTYIMAHGNQF